SGGKSGAAINLSEPSISRLLIMVNSGKMPPNSPLSTAEKATVLEWIQAGAPWPKAGANGGPAKRAGLDWWSLQPILRRTPPAVKDKNWVRNPLDAFVLAKLESKGLHPSPPADRATYIRRATFDLLGLPPTSQEIDTFVTDKSPNAYEKLI